MHDTNQKAWLEAARQAAKVELLPADCAAGEVAAFDVLVNGKYVGHWSQTERGRGGRLTWVPGGETVETGDCSGEKNDVIAAVRDIIPESWLAVET